MPEAETLEEGGGGGHTGDMEARLTKLEIGFEALRSSFDSMRWTVSLLAAMMLGGIAFFGTQLARIDNKVDAIPASISTEFRAMRTDMAAQTSAIANSITATKQQAPQVILMQAPQPEQPVKK